jgi:benzoyl-CoA reductase/2-hydroxyglutaryl-CoA dehydratase subunit BcrC/BadD/HgdB
LNARGATVVMDELNDVLWEPIDPADPYPGMARRILSTPLAWPIAKRAENIVRLARAYRVDGVINPCHFGCRQSTGARGLITRALREAGLPVLNLEVDCVDPRSFSAGQLQTRVEAFLELLDANPPPR